MLIRMREAIRFFKTNGPFSSLLTPLKQDEKFLLFVYYIFL